MMQREAVLTERSYSIIKKSRQSQVIKFPLIETKDQEDRRKLKSETLSRQGRGRNQKRSLDISEIRRNIRVLVNKIRSEEVGNKKGLPQIAKESIKLDRRQMKTEESTEEKGDRSRIHGLGDHDRSLWRKSKLSKKKMIKDVLQTAQCVATNTENRVPIFSIKLLKALSKNSIPFREKSSTRPKEAGNSKQLQSKNRKKMTDLELQVTDVSFGQVEKNRVKINRRYAQLQNNFSQVLERVACSAQSPSFERLVERENSDQFQASLMKASEERQGSSSVHLLTRQQSIAPWN